MEHILVSLLKKNKVVKWSEPGNSMTPIIRHREPILLSSDVSHIEVGDIVFCKVRGRYYTHKVKAICEQKGYLITNNHGHVNGWTKQIFGKYIGKPEAK
jgi:hypothetical protein